ncbi:hypothetical protein DKX38_014376 [Salix brachista]|uniref:Uncharacterized protein n=1 Tax=Salix brachista TaxID=2182728 RepID=A0A5N5LFK4_9ROSI|nr:hypothetical protein DKX38_014376 [Salix brachista]
MEARKDPTSVQRMEEEEETRQDEQAKLHTCVLKSDSSQSCHRYVILIRELYIYVRKNKRTYQYMVATVCTVITF